MAKLNFKEMLETKTFHGNCFENDINVAGDLMQQLISKFTKC